MNNRIKLGNKMAIPVAKAIVLIKSSEFLL
jgi:hypothetical protein